MMCPVLRTRGVESSAKSSESGGDALILLVANKTFRICLQKPVLCCCALHSQHEVVRVATGLVNLAMTKVGSPLQSIGHLQHSFLGLIQVLRKDKKQWHHQPNEHTMTKEQENSF